MPATLLFLPCSHFCLTPLDWILSPDIFGLQQSPNRPCSYFSAWAQPCSELVPLVNAGHNLTNLSFGVLYVVNRETVIGKTIKNPVRNGNVWNEKS